MNHKVFYIMTDNGWIKIHRKLKDHWLFTEKRKKTKLEAWLVILLECNHSNAKVLVNGSLISCGKGQSVKSIGTWAKKFKWSDSSTRSFFKLLEKDKMITIEGMQKTTRLTVCNYDSYQETLQTDDKQKSNKPQTNHDKQEEIRINKNDNNFKDVCLTDDIWIESVCRLNKTNIEVVKSMLSKFDVHLVANSENKKNIKEYKQHFNNWIRKQELKTKRINLGI